MPRATSTIALAILVGLLCVIIAVWLITNIIYYRSSLTRFGRTKQEDHESSHKSHEPSLHFVEDVHDVEAALATTYFDGFTNGDLRARGCPDSAGCREAYLGSVSKMTPSDKSTLRELTQQADALLLRHPGLRDMHRMGWRICKLGPQAENGFPHTHGDIIFMSARTIHGDSSDARVRTLIHEKCHIYQRLYPKACRSLYEQYWGYVRSPQPRSAYTSHGIITRSNPDIDDWVYGDPKTGRYCMQAFSTSTPTSLSDSHVVAVSIVKKGDDGQQLTYTTTPNCIYEHPNEAMAYLLSEWLTDPERSTHHHQGRRDYNNYEVQREVLLAGLQLWLNEKKIDAPRQ
jgi:hypothetical protein